MIIAVDFDGTCVEHEYPYIGKDIGAVPVLRELVNAGHKLILYTMRDEDTLFDAVDWFAEKKIPLFGVNVNPDQKYWTKSPKPDANLYIDDRALGIPLRKTLGKAPCVDWERVRVMLVHQGILRD